ncbi:MAG: hypothetical protein DYH12_29700, partial [Sorangiineae bacterium PRO1]|nr:hypothetical protein [Sorangiineae bacterium PRO1]
MTEFGEPFAVMAGTGIIGFGGISRFGDYSATVLDPSDSQRFWSFQEIADGEGGGAVAIAAFRAPEPLGWATGLAAGAT